MSRFEDRQAWAALLTRALSAWFVLEYGVDFSGWLVDYGPPEPVRDLDAALVAALDLWEDDPSPEHLALCEGYIRKLEVEVRDLYATYQAVQSARWN